MTDRIDISVVIPAYNAGGLIARTIRSVQEQTYAVREIIVVDDGSTDDTASVVKSMPGVTYIYQKNQGVSSARNRGIAAASSRWIAFLDSDDEWLPDKLRLQIEVLCRHPDLMWVAGAFTVFRNGKMHENISLGQDSPYLTDGVLPDALQLLLSMCGPWTGSVLIHRQALATVGGFPVGRNIGEDIDLWVRLAIRYPRIGYVAESAAQYNCARVGSLTSSAADVGDISVCRAIQSFIEAKEGLPQARRVLLEMYAWQMAVQTLRISLLRGRSLHCRRLLREYRQIGFGPIPHWIRLVSRVPEPLLRGMRTTFGATKSMLSGMNRMGAQ